MKTDTADVHWNEEWATVDAGSKWLTPEADVMAWAETLKPGARILDLGAGVGRHALWLAGRGFEVVALDAASAGLAEIDRAGGVETVLARMHALPFADRTFDHVLSWNVIYHGDEDVLLRTVGEIRRVLAPGGTFLGTMLSKRRLSHERKKALGREISRNTWVFEAPAGSDKNHPHYFCNAPELLAMFSGFEVLWLEDREHESEGSYHWHMKAERLL
ncbi:methyltransferase domain-containing protein [Maritimibacter sp. DP07]|uniref:Methyltransferase domain-containing protein n=1 Tax=Maritimibacter harenae TaxID=2606218 RepID=A0A845MC09_9RHOB|nr:class I SAM-dependent methyltransferase [Maritimibacter harenae]MZR15171.1 methyltransferase domain-containing protein [Maritimibacter harenae]